MSVFAHLLLLAYVRGMMRFTSNAPQVENILSKNTSADLPENLYNDVFNLHANGSAPDFPFLSPFGYAGWLGNKHITHKYDDFLDII